MLTADATDLTGLALSLTARCPDHRAELGALAARLRRAVIDWGGPDGNPLTLAIDVAEAIDCFRHQVGGDDLCAMLVDYADLLVTGWT